MKLVPQYGGLWKLSERRWRRLLKSIIKGEGYDLDDLGVKLNAEIVEAPLDMTQDRAKELLEERKKSSSKG